MKILFKKIETFLLGFIGVKINPLYLVVPFFGIIAIRIFVEFFMASSTLSFADILAEYLHNFFFFALSFLLIWLVISFFLKENPKNIAFFILWGFWLIIFPPILDILKTGGNVYWSFYVLGDFKSLLAQFMTVFGRLPSGIEYFGTKIIFLTAIFFSAFLVYIKTRHWFSAIFSALAVYAILFFMGSFPAWFAFGYYFLTGTKKVSEAQGFNIVQFWGTPAKIFSLQYENLTYALAYQLDLIYFLLLLAILVILFFFSSRKKFLAVLKNFRYPQIIYHSGLFFIGMGLGLLAYPQNFHLNLFSVSTALVLLASIWLAWKASVVANDIHDYQIDKISNPERPLQKNIFSIPEYAQFGAIVFFLSLLGGLVVNPKFLSLLFIYQFLAWAYSAPPFRLKKFPVIATFVSAAASLVVLLIGFALFSGDQNMHNLSWRIIILLVVALTLSLPIKDFKDIEGDKKYGIYTIPVILGEEKSRLIVAVGIFISFMLSVFLLNEFRLFWWALLFGIISFLIVIKIKPRQLFWWVLGAVSIYGIILVKNLFL